MEEKTIDTEAVVEAPKAQDNPAAAPAEQKEAEDTKGIDPRIVEIVGQEKIQSAFGEKPEEDGEPAEEEAPKEEQEEKKQEENQEEKAENKEVEIPKIAPLEAKPTRLDRRLASRYIRNLHLMGETNIPTEEEIIADLKNHSKEDKIQALHFHLQKEKELRGEKPSNELDDEDKAAIQDAEREAIRHEILAEEHEIKEKGNFVNFIGEHTELLPNDDPARKDFPDAKPYDPVLAEAVETLFKNGMRIDKAFETVTTQIEAVKAAQETKEKNEKNAALSGVLSGTGQVIPQDKQLGWDEVAQIEKEDPALYKKMLAEGKFKHLM